MGSVQQHIKSARRLNCNTMPLPKFAYWNCQGLGQPVRMVLKFNNEAYEDTAYDLRTPDDWHKIAKSKLGSEGLPFPNLPYYIDGDIKLSQSSTVLKHVGRKYNMYGTNDTEAAQIDMLIDVSMDMRYGLAMAAYAQPDFEQMKKDMTERFQPVFKKVSEFLGSKKYLMGDSVTVADFPMYHAMKYYSAMNEDILSEFGNLLDFIKRFEDHPNVKAFLDSELAFEGKFFSPAAHWGASYKGE